MQVNLDNSLAEGVNPVISVLLIIINYMQNIFLPDIT